MLFILIIISILLGVFLSNCVYNVLNNNCIFNYKIKAFSLKYIIRVIDFINKKHNSYIKLKKYNNLYIKYVIIELITIVSTILTYKKYGLTEEFFKYIIVICFLIVIASIDLFTQNVYCDISIIFLLFTNFYLGYKILIGSSIKNNIFGGIIGFFIICLIILITNGMGWGDAEVCFILGLFLGKDLIIPIILFSFIIGGIIASYILVLKIKSSKAYIPFLPFVFLSTFIIIFFKEYLIIFLQ